MQYIRNWRVTTALLFVSMSYVNVVRANKGIIVEGVGDYSACGWTSIDMDQEAAGLYSGLTGAGSPWAGSQYNIPYYNENVWDTDFYDPEITNSSEGDTWNFDNSNVTLSAFFGHGNCNDVRAPIPVACATNNDCPANSYCPVFPLNGNFSNGTFSKACIDNITKIMFTCSRSDSHSPLHYVQYGLNLNNIAWGESPSQTWRGAGNNGGTNIAFIVSSCSARSKFFPSQLQSMFGGLHMMMIAMPTAAWKRTSTGARGYSDLWELSQRGNYLAQNIMGNLNAHAIDAWLNTNVMSFGNVGEDAGLSKGYGLHMVVAFDATAAAAMGRLMFETWYSSMDDNQDATGNAAWAISYRCNYDCVAYPPPLP